MSMQSQSHADEDRTAAALKMIGDFANQICQTAPVERTETDIELSGDAKAKVGGVISKLADLGLQGSGKYRDQSNSNILVEKDLIIAIQGGNNCKLDVFHSLERDLLSRSETGSGSKKATLIDYQTPSEEVYCKRLRSVIDSVKSNFKGLLGPTFGSANSWTANIRLPSAKWCVVNTFPGGFGNQAPHKYYSCMLDQDETNAENMKIKLSSYAKSTIACLGPSWSGSALDQNYDISDAEVIFSKDDGGPTVQLRASGKYNTDFDLAECAATVIG